MESLGSHLVQTSYFYYQVEVICFLLVSEDDWQQSYSYSKEIPEKIMTS